MIPAITPGHPRAGGHPRDEKESVFAIDVNTISIQELARDRLGQRVVVGVDVARGELVMCVVWPDREFERPWRVKSPEEIHLVVTRLLELNQSCPVTVAMESEKGSPVTVESRSNE